ncbi:MAG: hypothetical protein O9322_02190 [Beijerinckiaceae bacterium]|nr:hypothetical protein [Beijerinckiaceae bacterium]MCZ8301372.1 hypothetical protein [Beijerinckiaceae bacterium]
MIAGSLQGYPLLVDLIGSQIRLFQELGYSIGELEFKRHGMVQRLEIFKDPTRIDIEFEVPESYSVSVSHCGEKSNAIKFLNHRGIYLGNRSREKRLSIVETTENVSRMLDALRGAIG